MTYPSARGQKSAERANRPIGINTIVTIWWSGDAVETAWGPAYESWARTPEATIESALDNSIVMGRKPLLWSYAQPDANYSELKFGFDHQVNVHDTFVKIGHVALASEATISGEIYREGARWRINNESGAWGNMGGHSGKSKKLEEVAEYMNILCGGMVVVADRAYSRNVVKRKIQQLYR